MKNSIILVKLKLHVLVVYLKLKPFSTPHRTTRTSKNIMQREGTPSKNALADMNSMVPPDFNPTPSSEFHGVEFDFVKTWNRIFSFCDTPSNLVPSRVDSKAGAVPYSVRIGGGFDRGW